MQWLVVKRATYWDSGIQPATAAVWSSSWNSFSMRSSRTFNEFSPSHGLCMTIHLRIVRLRQASSANETHLNVTWLNWASHVRNKINHHTGDIYHQIGWAAVIIVEQLIHFITKHWNVTICWKSMCCNYLNIIELKKISSVQWDGRQQYIRNTTEKQVFYCELQRLHL